MPFINLKDKLVRSQFRFTHLIIYISLSKLKPKPNGMQSFSFY